MSGGLEATEPLPMQPLERDEEGVVRFRANSIVRFLLDVGPFDLNRLAAMHFSAAERAQFAQLIGYSVSGWCELSCVTPEQAAEAERLSSRDGPARRPEDGAEPTVAAQEPVVGDAEKRDELAATAWREILVGRLRPPSRDGRGNPEPQEAARLAYAYADAFLAIRSES